VTELSFSQLGAGRRACCFHRHATGSAAQSSVHFEGHDRCAAQSPADGTQTFRHS